jgi:ACS family glucarate transporter-like MFS transporter
MRRMVTDIRPARRVLRVRWLILTYLLAFTIAAYVQRTSVSVAAEPMMPQLGLTQLQIGWLETAFLVSYTVLQFPGAVFGQFLGVRRMLTLCGAISVLATIAIPLLPSVARGAVLFATLLAAQFVLGAVQAPLFAMVSGALERWFPPRQWALTQGLSAAGIGLGGAASPVIITVIMVATNWRIALIAVACPVAVLVALWWWQARDAPDQHPWVTAAELAELPHRAGPRSDIRPNWPRLRALLLNRDLLGLSLSYLLMNVVFYLITFWSFLYLVQARHFAVLQGGLATAAPLLGGAAGAALGGLAGSALHRRFGPTTGLRILPLVTLPAACLLLLIGVHAQSSTLALAALTFSFGCLEMNEAVFWAASMEIGAADAVAAGGILNTGGNLGGIVATPIVAALSGAGDWTAPFVLAAAAALLAAAIWLLIDPGRPASAQGRGQAPGAI